MLLVSPSLLHPARRSRSRDDGMRARRRCLRTNRPVSVGAADSHREVGDACPVHQIVALLATSEPPPFQLERRASHEGEKDTGVPPPR